MSGSQDESDVDRRLRKAIETGAPIRIALGFEPDREGRERLEDLARECRELGIDVSVGVDRSAQKARVQEKIGDMAERWFK
jgi:4-hydroxy-3-methylbut-2-en-1-yl diphosphate synthase IspG/GcpE